MGGIARFAARITIMAAVTLTDGSTARLAAGPPRVADVAITYLTRDYAEPLPLSLVEPIVTDSGTRGAEVGLFDNQATGRLLGHAYTLNNYKVSRSSDVASEARASLMRGDKLIVADLEPEDLIAIADMPEAADALIINLRSSDDVLRGKDCKRNVFHVAPSWAMRADALAQYFAWKQWQKLFALHGTAPHDQGYAAAMRRAAKRFGIKIVEERTFTFDAGNRRTDTGHQQIQSQMPLLTQSPPEHDLIFVADTQETFGEFLMWRTSLPKPVTGTQGLVAVAWHRSFEQFGGTQLHSRFEKYAKRPMTERDYLAWLAVRTFGEAVTRIGTADPKTIRAFLLSPEFEIAGFKGQGMTFRTWDRQLRQPILLTGPRSLVSISPQDGYLHPHFLTDTLGYDRPESDCPYPN